MVNQIKRNKPALTLIIVRINSVRHLIAKISSPQ